jgi:hypothetical protein
MRRRSERVLWVLNTVTALLVWVVTLILAPFTPEILNLSVWRPASLFISQLELHMDQVGWLFIYATSTVVLSIVFTSPARPDETTPVTKSIILSYAGIAMMALLAGNLLTVILSWALLDIVGFLFQVRVRSDETKLEDHLIRLAVDGAGMLCVLAAALVNRTAGGGSSLAQPLSSTLAAVLLVAAALLRLGLLPPRIRLPQLTSEQRSLGLLLQLLPPVAALALLTRMLNTGVPTAAYPWLQVTGGIGVLLGCLRWGFERDLIRSRPFLVLGISGLGVFVTSLGSSAGGNALLSAGIILLLSGTVISLADIYSPTHRLWPGLAGLLLAGLPGTPAGVLSGSLSLGFVDNIVLGLLGVIGLTTLAVGAFRKVFQPVQAWPTGESLVRIIYGLGLALPVFVAVGVGIRLPGSSGLRSFLVFLLATGIAIPVTIWIQRRPERSLVRWERALTWMDPSPLYRGVLVITRAIMNTFRNVGNIFEGEGATLWMLVILILIFLASGWGT